VAVEVELDLQAFYVATLAQEKVTTLQLFSSIVGLAGILARERPPP
jgi:hypothetical protein